MGKCEACIACLALDGPIGEECTYPDGPCLKQRIERGQVGVREDETFSGSCAREERISKLANSFRVGGTDFQADQDAREIIEDADLFGPRR